MTRFLMALAFLFGAALAVLLTPVLIVHLFGLALQVITEPAVRFVNALDRWGRGLS